MAEWTASLPTEPGFYWVLTPWENAPGRLSIAEINNANGRYFTLMGSDEFFSVDELPGIKFYGPIPSPPSTPD